MALWPDEAVRVRIDALVRAFERQHPGARRTASANLHLTLAFIGALSAERSQAVASMLARLRVERRSWTIDCIGYFPKAHVLWAGGATDAALLDLAAVVREGLDALGVAYDRKAFAPHVTLLRGLGRDVVPVPRDLLAGECVDWPLGAPVLLVSARDTDGRTLYRPWLDSG